MRRSWAWDQRAMVDVGIDVGVEAVLAAVGLVPGRRGAACRVKWKRTMDFADLKPYFHGTTTRIGSAVLVGQGLAVAAEGEQGERVHGLVHAKAFAVGPVVAGGEVGHLLSVVEREKNWTYLALGSGSQKLMNSESE